MVWRVPQISKMTLLRGKATVGGHGLAARDQQRSSTKLVTTPVSG